jgi:hypothetical protein
MELRYTGFDQRHNKRLYKFDCVEKGQATVQLVVTADLALFLKHRISLQEGPALCARKLNANPAGLGHHELTDGDLLVFVTARAAEEARKAELRRKANVSRRWPSRPTPELPNL